MANAEEEEANAVPGVYVKNMLSSLPGALPRDTDPTVSVLWVSMLQWSSSLDGYTPFGARLLLIHCSVILRVLGVPAEGVGVRVPTLLVTTHPGYCCGYL